MNGFFVNFAIFFAIFLPVNLTLVRISPRFNWRSKLRSVMVASDLLILCVVVLCTIPLH